MAEHESRVKEAAVVQPAKDLILKSLWHYGRWPFILMIALGVFWGTKDAWNNHKEKVKLKEAKMTQSASQRTLDGPRFEIVGVDAPTGKDANGNDAYSMAVLVPKYHTSFGFQKHDPGTGCFLVKMNGKPAGESCKDGLLNIDVSRITEDWVNIQFHGKDRPMKLFIRKPTSA